MNSMADITVKKNDGSTDIVYVAQQPSAGDKSPAIWRADALGAAIAFRPEYRLTAKDSPDGKSRLMTNTYRYPQIATDSTTTLVSVVKTASFNLQVNLPKEMTQADINEACAQYANLLDSTLIQACLKAGASAM